MFNTIRYVIAMMVLMSYPVALFLWIFIHPLASFWRRLGIALTYGILSIPSLVWMGGIYLYRKSILAKDLGTNIIPISLGLVCMGAAIYISKKRRQYLTFGLLAGNPELSPKKYPGKLLSGGPYARIRHPRYVEVSLLTLGYTLLANYPAAYLMFVLSTPLFFIVVILEERELHQRFGKEYEEYCRQVPRFIPKGLFKKNTKYS
jgi:protein-S-isoprenylcysteine O-methyltransferase Ste14